MQYDIIEADSILEGGDFYKNPLYDKFTEVYSVKDYEVLSDNGWIDIEGIGKTISYPVYQVITSGGKELKCADDHILIKCFNIDFETKKTDLNEIHVKDLSMGDLIMTKDGPEMIMEINDLGYEKEMYDLQIDRESEHLFYTNDILSHNSLWMQNFAVNSANKGYNVLYITLEMSVKKTLKRLGSMRLKVPIDKYDYLSNDTEFMKKKIDNLHKMGTGNDLFEGKKQGKIITKFFPAGTATIDDFDVLIKKIKEKKGLDIDMLVVDYITLMAPVRGLGIESNLYLKGKHLAEGLRAIAAKYELTLITGMQIAKDAWNSTDITLDKIPESKAIAETADTFFAIIRTEDMKRQNIYRLKMLKQRDGDFSKSQVKFDLNPKYLTIENDIFIDAL